MTGKKSIKKSLRNHHVKKSIRLVKKRISDLNRKELTIGE
jgi:hypothetical protein